MTDLVYILGASHSGSTLLAMLLATHRHVCTMGEMKATHLGDVFSYRCSCGEVITQCSFWRKVQATMADRGISFEITQARTAFRNSGDKYIDTLLKPLHRGQILEAVRDAALFVSPVWRHRMPVVQWRNAMLAEVLCDLTGTRIIVDSSKTGLRLKYLLRTPGLNVKVIHLVRDGRAVALTYTRPDWFADATDPAVRAGGAGGDRADERQSIVAAARQWRRSTEEAECVLAPMDPARWMQVRYEQLCADPPATLGEVFGFLDLDPAEAERVDRFRQTVGHVIGNGMRLDRDPTIAADHRWRNELTGDDLVAFDAIAGRLNNRYGYS